MNSLLARRITMAHLPTPVHYLPRLSKTLGISLFVKRDDLTESVASGNKLRKMEYLLFEAREQGADTLVTCGGVQSQPLPGRSLGRRQGRPPLGAAAEG